SFYRVIEGFVAQGGDPFGARELPEGAVETLKAEFDENKSREFMLGLGIAASQYETAACNQKVICDQTLGCINDFPCLMLLGHDNYAGRVGSTGFLKGFPTAHHDEGQIGGRLKHPNEDERYSLIHCTGAFAFGRENDPDTASTEFYITLQPQRYLDRNLTVFGRVIDGMEHVQALTRQAPPEKEDDPLGDVIVRAWMGDTPPEGETTPAWQVFRTDTEIFADYVESRRNRPEAFFIYRPNHVDVCQLPIPVRQTPVPGDGDEDTP
ncbi:MAG: peptidylprolyl isomerase, partial [Pseudomonadota bacterium]